jgi:DNA-binding NtrC family response regulator
MKIRVRARNAYGVTLLDPINESAKWLAVIAGTKTLTVQVLIAAIKMGAEVEVSDSPDAGAILDVLNKVAEAAEAA